MMDTDGGRGDDWAAATRGDAMDVAPADGSLMASLRPGRAFDHLTI